MAAQAERDAGGPEPPNPLRYPRRGQRLSWNPKRSLTAKASFSLGPCIAQPLAALPLTDAAYPLRVRPVLFLGRQTGPPQERKRSGSCGGRRSKGACVVFAARRKRSQADFATTTMGDADSLRRVGANPPRRGRHNIQTNSPYSAQVLLPVIRTSANRPIRVSGPLIRTSRLPSVREARG